MFDGELRLFKDRKYQMIPINLIKVINSRNRDEIQFQENVNSIKDIGLLKPIVVNERYFKNTHFYELVCGEGRFIAYKSLNYPHIPAEVVDCDRKQALILSLVENIARVPPNTMWFARALKQMKDSGWSCAAIAKVAGKCESYINDYIKLVEQGEERLIKGVENGLFPMNFALLVARSDNSDIQRLLMDAYDEGIISSKNMNPVKKVLELRINRGKKTSLSGKSGKRKEILYSVQELKRDIRKVITEKTSFVNETKKKENRLFTLIDGLVALWKDKEFLALLEKENVGPKPQLKGKYDGYEC
jgi:ParB family chromosome partitioning protein